jgi:hypothetical protein
MTDRVPMNLRDASGKLELGNRVTSLFVELPLTECDPLERLMRITDRTQQLKQSGAGAGASTLMPLAADHAVGIAILSFNGRVTFGLNADAPSTRDLAVLRHGVEAGLDELRALLPGADPAVV